MDASAFVDICAFFFLYMLAARVNLQKTSQRDLSLYGNRARVAFIEIYLFDEEIGQQHFYL